MPAPRTTTRLRFQAPRIALAALFLALPLASARAQQFLADTLADTLPNAPGLPPEQHPDQDQAPTGTAAITGLVLDVTEVTIPRATVTLTGPAGLTRTTLSDNDGYFAFPGLPAGAYKIIIASPGLEGLEFPDVHILAGEQRELPRIALPLAATSATVSVVATPDEIATEQVAAEEKQRVFLIFPNFYSTYIWNAAPLRAHNKFSLAVHSLTDPVGFMVTGALAGVEQIHNTFPGYDSGAAGYFERYGAAYADHFTGRILGDAVFPSLFHQDPRYFYMGTGSVPHRAFYAMSSSIICRGDNSHRQLNYSHILGSLASAGISNFYRAPSDRTPGVTIRNAFIGLGTRAAGNLVREFLFRKISTHVPTYAKGKPPEQDPGL